MVHVEIRVIEIPDGELVRERDGRGSDKQHHKAD
jgi:hypothetical protein